MIGIVTVALSGRPTGSSSVAAAHRYERIAGGRPVRPKCQIDRIRRTTSRAVKPPQEGAPARPRVTADLVTAIVTSIGVAAILVYVGGERDALGIGMRALRPSAWPVFAVAAGVALSLSWRRQTDWSRVRAHPRDASRPRSAHRAAGPSRAHRTAERRPREHEDSHGVEAGSALLRSRSLPSHQRDLRPRVRRQRARRGGPTLRQRAALPATRSGDSMATSSS